MAPATQFAPVSIENKIFEHKGQGPPPTEHAKVARPPLSKNKRSQRRTQGSANGFPKQESARLPGSWLVSDRSDQEICQCRKLEFATLDRRPMTAMRCRWARFDPTHHGTRSIGLQRRGLRDPA